MKMFRSLFLIVSLILATGLACNLFPVGATPTAVPQASPTSDGAVNNIQDAQKAVIQIESDGTFVDPQEGLVLNGAGRGSGFIIDPTGIAVTNNHVVTGAALIKVWVNGETSPRHARILGVSECSDLAVIQIEGSDFSYVKWYDQAPKPGLEVYTAGFPLGLHEYSLTKGIISKDRTDGQTNWASLDHVLMHDATINPGNSGGPLLTENARVVGINFASLKSASQYFAIDAATAKPLVDKLKEGQDIDTIGINGTAFITNDKSVSGIWIASVKSGSLADKTGIKAGDILLQMEGLVLATDGTMKDYCSILRTHKPSDTFSVKVFRYSTREILEGQLNGRTLQTVQSTANNQQGTSTFGQIHASSIVIKFYGSGTGILPAGQRVYTNRFSQKTARYIMWELNLVYPKPGRRIDFVIHDAYYKSNGDILGQDNMNTYVLADWGSSQHMSGKGWDSMGNWPKGTYTVVLSVDNVEIGRSYFTVE